jgi:hypothetical protein
MLLTVEIRFSGQTCQHPLQQRHKFQKPAKQMGGLELGWGGGLMMMRSMTVSALPFFFDSIPERDAPRYFWIIFLMAWLLLGVALLLTQFLLRFFVF